MTKTIILFGANSAIAHAYLTHLDKSTERANIVCISQSKLAAHDYQTLNVRHYQSDYSELSLASVIDDISIGLHTKASADKNAPIHLSQVIIFNGVLHSSTFCPEKKLEDINFEQFNQTMQTNALVPITCLMSVLPLLNHQSECTITALSARVGSITDNKLGGWYSYRASKAALNMLFKTAAIELARRAKNTQLILFHPGTTDTPLSKPFQKNVPKGKLFSPEFVAAKLAAIIASTAKETAIAQPLYLDWQGKKINW